MFKEELFLWGKKLFCSIFNLINLMLTEHEVLLTPKISNMLK